MISEKNKPIKWLFILNPRAGGRPKTRLKEKIQRYMSVPEESFAASSKNAGAKDAVVSGRKNGYTGFVAVGGDGTINLVAKELMGTKDILGIIPAGSGNGLATWLGIRKNIRQNIALLQEGNLLPMDMGTVNDIPFINLAGVGFDAQVAHATKDSKLRGLWPYLLASIRLVFSNIYWQGKVQWEGGIIEDSFLSVIVANGAVFGYGFRLVPKASVHDGLFSVLLIKKVARWRYIIALPSLLLGRRRIFPWMQLLESTHLILIPDDPIPIHIDGEAIDIPSPFIFTIHPSCILTSVPTL